MQRGLDERHEQNPHGLLRDTRPMGQRVADFFKNSAYVSILLFMLAAAGFIMPGVTDLFFMIGLVCFLVGVTRKTTLPFRMPQRSKKLDYNDPLPGSIKPRAARGICLFGNDRKTNEELWFNNDDMRTHCLIFGSTGSGKTEALISLAFNALVQSSGFIYVDGKGDNSLYAKVFGMARSMGREDDLLIVNFMTGARDIVGPQERRLSNTMNPFANGSSSMLSQLVVSLMDAGGSSPDADMWKGRAIVFVESLMKVLVYMRDRGHILLDANTIRNYFELPKLESIVMDKQFPRDNQESVSLADVPPVVLEPISNYLINLPGYDRSKKGKQVSQVLEQHGFITMQLTRVFGSLADTYGHIIRTNLAEVDLRDVVLNRRILVVLLPAFEKSPDELSNLGKVIIASLKSMLASGLGEDVEGEYRDVILRKPTNAPTPFMCILDEYGYYAVKGFAVVPAQARSLGFSIIFAGQDLPAFQKASKEEAASIGANCNIKICMKLEDPLETWDFFSKTAGESYVTKVDSFQTRPDSMTNSYADTRSSSAEKRARIDLLDMKEQREGEAHIFFKSKIVRARMFYADPKMSARMRVNQFLKVESPPSRVLTELEKRLRHFQAALATNTVFAAVSKDNEEIELIADLLQENAAFEPIERGVNVLIAIYNRSQNEEEAEPEEEMPQDQLDIFTSLRVPTDGKKLLLTDDLERFSAPLLTKNAVREQVAVVERLTGKIDKHANSIAEEIIKDMRTATYYPPLIENHIEEDDIINVAHELNKHLKDAREAASDD